MDSAKFWFATMKKHRFVDVQKMFRVKKPNKQTQKVPQTFVEWYYILHLYCNFLNSSKYA